MNEFNLSLSRSSVSLCLSIYLSSIFLCLFGYASICAHINSRSIYWVPTNTDTIISTKDLSDKTSLRVKEYDIRMTVSERVLVITLLTDSNFVTLVQIWTLKPRFLLHAVTSWAFTLSIPSLFCTVFKSSLQCYFLFVLKYVYKMLQILSLNYRFP